MALYVILSVLALGSSAAPAPDVEAKAEHPVGQPFVHAVLPLDYLGTSSWGGDLFRRQGCPQFLCNGGHCCDYDTSCCGDTCCPMGYLCTGGTAEAPCCVAIDAPTNECGSSNSAGNPCTEPGDVPCDGINICCPPANLCYFDNNNIARCSPLADSAPSTTVPVTSSETSPPPLTSDSILPDTTTFSSSSSTTWSDVSFTPDTSPTDPPDPDSGEPTHHYSSTFWTGANIGAVAGGAVGGLILLGVLIYIFFCCIPKRRRERRAREIEAARVKALSNYEISRLVDSVVSPVMWQEMYTAEARRMRDADRVDRTSWMVDFSTRAIEQVVLQLQNGGDKLKAKLTAGGIGAIPGIRYLNWFKDPSKDFVTVSIWYLGMGGSNPDTMRDLHARAKAAAGASTLLARIRPAVEWAGEHAFKEWWADSDLAEQVRGELAQFMADELGQEAATAFLTELLQIKPFIGWGFAGFRAARKCDQKMDKALVYLQAVAMSMHARIYVVNALKEVYPSEYGGTEKDQPFVYAEPVF